MVISPGVNGDSREIPELRVEKLTHSDVSLSSLSLLSTRTVKRGNGFRDLESDRNGSKNQPTKETKSCEEAAIPL